MNKSGFYLLLKSLNFQTDFVVRLYVLVELSGVCVTSDTAQFLLIKNYRTTAAGSLIFCCILLFDSSNKYDYQI